MIDETKTIRRAPGLITAAVEGESVVLNADTGMFFQLNLSAARIWDKIETPQTLDGLVEQLVERFDVTPAACRADVIALVDTLTERGLVEAY